MRSDAQMRFAPLFFGAETDVINGSKRLRRPVVIFVVRFEEKNLMGLRKNEWMAWFVGLAILASLVGIAGAQGQNTFRDTTLPDSVRIQNLLSQLTLDEKVLLMSDHPKIPRLG